VNPVREGTTEKMSASNQQGERSRPATMSLLDADPAFGLAVPAEHRERARRYLTFDVRRMRSVWEEGGLDGEQVVGGLVLTGFLLGTVDVGDRRASFVLGPGDVVAPRLMPAVSTFPASTRIDVVQPASLLVLDDRVWTAAAYWPSVGRTLFERSADGSAGQRLLSALNAFSRVDERLLGLMWYFADRWGTVRSDGVHVGLPLTHRTLGELVACRRPTVTLALGALSERGLLTRTQDGWLLALQLLDALEELAAGSGDSRAIIDPTASIFDRADAIVRSAAEARARARELRRPT
jgi:hypothetical protein